MGATGRILSLSSILIFHSPLHLSPKRFLSISIPSTCRVFQGFRPICSSTIFTTTAAAVELDSQGPPPASDKHSIRHLKDSSGSTLNTPQTLNPPKPSKVLGKNDETQILDSDFEELGLSEEVLAALREMGISAPTEIQSIGIPAVLQGKSVVLCSHTGSGKTLAYLLPIIQLLRRDELELGIQMKCRCPRAIILCPTKELSEQVFHVAKCISHHARFRSTMELPQEDSLNIPTDMLVGAPDQILQHIEDRDLICDDIKYLVLDEADTLFDHGFGADIFKFLDLLKNRASKPNDPGFQTVLLAATMTTAVQKFINEEQGISHLKMRVCGIISDIGTYNVLIGGLCKSNELDKALSLYSDMKSSGISPNADILTNLISSASEQQMVLLFEDSRDILEIESFLTLCDSVLSSLVKNELIDKAYTLLRLITEKLFNVEGVFWSKFTFFHTLMAGLCKYGKLDAALDLLKDLDKLPFKKDVTLYNDLIYALSNSNRVDDCFELLKEMKLHQLQPTHFTYNSIYLYYCRKSDTAGALELVKEMRLFGHSPWIKHTTLLMKSLCNKGRALEAVDYLSEIVKSGARPDIVPFSVALEGLIKLQKLDQAADFFKEMCSHGKIPDVIAYNILIKGFCKAKRMSEAEDVFKELLGNGLLPSVITYNSLIDGWCKNGNIEKALLLLRSMNTELPNVVTYTTLIDGLFNAGLIDDAISLWDEMEMKGCKPNRISFMALINGLCKNSRPSDALSFLRQMNERGFHADGFIYIALLTGFLLKENACSAYDVLKEMIDKEIVVKPEDKNHSVLEDAVLKLYLDPSTSSHVQSLIASGAIPTISLDELRERSEPVT